MILDERRQQAMRYVAERGFVALPELASELGVSESTARRDLAQLEQEGIVRRTRGGAVFISDRFSVLSYAVRESIEAAGKHDIGRTAATLIEDGDAVLLDGGTTTYQLARELTSRSLQVVTNSLPIATLFGGSPEIEVVVIGGYLYPRTGVACGPLAQRMLEDVHVNKLFMGAAGIVEDGCYNANALMVEAERQMMRSADEVIILADHTKFGRRALVKLCGFEEVNCVVSDENLSDSWRAVMGRVNVRLLLAEGNSSDGETRS